MALRSFIRRGSLLACLLLGAASFVSATSSAEGPESFSNRDSSVGLAQELFESCGSGTRLTRSSPAGIRGAAKQLGGGACCQAGGVCSDVEDDAACSLLSGFYFEGESCSEDPCGIGACCSDASCALQDAFGCLSGGREFAGSGTDCLSDPCGGGIGACCRDGDCSETGLDACSIAGGAWLGAGTRCADGPCELGSCCSPGSCDSVALFECDLAGGNFEAGGLCDGDACKVENDCATDSLFTQRRDLPNAFTAYTSEEASGFTRWENFSEVVGAIDDVTWWGLDLELVNGTFVECVDPTGLFSVTVRRDRAGRPGEAVCSFQGEVAQSATGIDYAGAELNEYRVTLPEACILTQGWISIEGAGDPDCWFLWMSSTGGDDRSLCDGCETPVAADDLSLCLGGSAGGITGSCCDASTGACTDGIDIADCVGVGQSFGPGDLCSQLDPPCAQETGACCEGAGGCEVRLPSECADVGGTWLGADAPCSFCPAIGACCSGVDSCFLSTETECQDQAASWLGADTTCDECPTTPECSPGSLYPQSPDDPDDFVAGTSEAGTPFRRSENFEGVSGVTRAVRWWGLDLDNIDGTDNFVECVEPDPTFELSFSEDAGGVPGDTVCSATLVAERNPSGLLYLGAELNEYRAELPQGCPVTEGWVSIVGQGDPECWFLWMSAGLGESHCDGCIPEAQDFDLGVCLAGVPGGATGACCDDGSARCSDRVDIRQCADPALRFAADTTCSALTPPCGTVLGACCRDNATCDRTTQSECDADGGNWQGPNTLCDRCPCTVSCPASSRPEGEPECRDGYDDRFNAGCDAFPPVFSPIEIGDRVCGSSGLFLDGLEIKADTDWYEVEVDREGVLTWSASAEFVATVSILDAGAGCPGQLLGAASALECGTSTVSVPVDPGTYWLVVEPAAFTDSGSCPSAYSAQVSLAP